LADFYLTSKTEIQNRLSVVAHIRRGGREFEFYFAKEETVWRIFI
jgi:hypothetical protein